MSSTKPSKSTLIVIRENFDFDQTYSKDEIYRKFQELGLVSDSYFGRLKSWWYLRRIHSDSYRYFGEFCKAKHKKGYYYFEYWEDLSIL